MTSIVSQPWFVWSLVIIVGFPILLVALSEAQSTLRRNGNPMARPVGLLRNWILPSGVLILLLTQASQISSESTWVRVVATFFGFMLMLLVLSALNIALFTQAESGSWRERLPSIFVDIVRLVLIIAGLAMIFAYVWGADVAGLFTALGVTSVVLGFALQNAVGSIVSGLLLLFEQPFKIGDWLDAGGVRGRVVEVNWRAVHVDVGSGLQIVPNASLAGSSFTNLSRPTPDHVEVVESTFSLEDPPGQVIPMLERIAAALPMIHPTIPPTAALVGPKTYTTAIPVTSPALAGAAASVFLRWLWYAARREGLHLDGLTDDYSTTERAEAALRQVAGTLHLRDDDVAALAEQVLLQRFTAGEIVQAEGTVPEYLSFVLEGRVGLRVPTADGAHLKVAEVEPYDYVGQSVLTRERALSTTYAIADCVLLRLPRQVIDDLVHARADLAVDIGRVIDQRRTSVREAVAQAGTSLRPAIDAPTGSRWSQVVGALH